VAWAEVEQLEHVVAGDQAGDVRLWDMESGQRECSLAGFRSLQHTPQLLLRAAPLAIHPCPKYPVLLLSHPAVVCKLEAHGLGVSALACMAPVSLLATGSADTSIKLWLLGAASNTRSTSGACAVAAGNSGDRTHQTQQPWSPKAAVHTLQGHSAPITRLQFTPDGEMLISGDESGCLRVWHVACGRAGRLLQELAGSHTAAVTGIACHPEERLMATCSLDGTVKVWDLDAQFGTCIGVHAPAGCGEVRAVAFAAGGRALLAAYPTGLRTFTLDPLTHHDSADVPWREVSAALQG
jgi:WD40 repeat protein